MYRYSCHIYIWFYICAMFVLRFETELDLPQLPEMTYANNLLQLLHDGGFGIEFNAFDALKRVDSKNAKMENKIYSKIIKKISCL